MQRVTPVNAITKVLCIYTPSLIRPPSWTCRSITERISLLPSRWSKSSIRVYRYGTVTRANIGSTLCWMVLRISCISSFSLSPPSLSLSLSLSLLSCKFQSCDRQWASSRFFYIARKNFGGLRIFDQKIHC